MQKEPRHTRNVSPSPGNFNPQKAKVVYFENDRIRPSLFREEARQAAEQLKNVDHTQVRRFFNAVEQLRRRLPRPDNPEGPKRFGAEELRAQLALLHMRALYAAARDPKNTPIADFIGRNVRAVTVSKDPIQAFREGFRPHFEAVIGFHKALDMGLDLREIA